ncbi:MAG: hypothetical protein D6718_04725 [Acidobacteria bacterium]|nr:MAG: hypothetical protein D6718_04725 [Acidobacteriota bacterium]
MVTARLALTTGAVGIGALAVCAGLPVTAGMGCQIDARGAACFVLREPGAAGACRTPRRDACELIVRSDPGGLPVPSLDLVTVSLDPPGSAGRGAAFHLLADHLEGRPEAARVLDGVGIVVGLRRTDRGARVRVCLFAPGETTFFESEAFEMRPGQARVRTILAGGVPRRLAVRYQPVQPENLARTPAGLALLLETGAQGGGGSHDLVFDTEERRAPAACPP